MTTTPDFPDFRALCTELLDELQGYKVAHPMHCRARLNRARIALATPPPEPPTDDELIEIARQLRETAGYLQLGCGWDRAIKAIESASILIEGDLFQRLAPPPEPPTYEELFEMFHENDWNYICPETYEDIVRAALERWGK